MGRPPKYNCNESYFSDITSDSQAYFLGLIWADGTMQQGHLRIVLREADDILLRTFCKDIEYTGPIYTRIVAAKRYSELTITRKAITADLCKIGLTSNKSSNNAQWPDISSRALPHFIRGLFDGDGSIHRSNFGFAASICGGYDFLLHINEEIFSKVGIRARLRQRRKGNLNACQIEFNSGESLVNFYNYIYPNEACFGLPRKRDKLKSAVDRHKARRGMHRQRMGAVACYSKQGRTPAEISSALGLPPKKVYQIRARAKKMGLWGNPALEHK